MQPCKSSPSTHGTQLAMALLTLKFVLFNDSSNLEGVKQLFCLVFLKLSACFMNKGEEETSESWKQLATTKKISIDASQMCSFYGHEFVLMCRFLCWSELVRNTPES